MVNVGGKVAAGPRQARIRKTNAIEPLMTCRKQVNDVETGASSLARDKSKRGLSTAWAASGMEAA